MSDPAAGRAPASVIIVGASAAGLTTAEALRRKGFAGSLTLIGDEDHLPYDRPPLSKQVLSGIWPPDRVRLREREHLAQLGVELITGDAAVGLDVDRRSVTTASGQLRRGEVVVIATGMRPRTLPDQPELSGMYQIRTLDDVVALRSALRPGDRVLIVGDGVLGTELAATVRGLGHRVTLIGPQQVLMQRQLGSDVGTALTELHAGRGVDLRPDRTVEKLIDDGGRFTGARLAGGDEIDADVVVLALGGLPATDWLAGSGLDLIDGVGCDSRCRATENIYAVGDVARWHHQRLGRKIRLENRTNATEQALAVADNILGADRPYVPVPHFWTDQYDARIQVHGIVPAEAELAVTEGRLSDRRFVGHALMDGRPVGVIGWNMPKQTRQHRRRVLESVESAP